MGYIAIFFIVTFLLFAGLQFNDPDPVLWVTLYLVPAYVSYRAWQKKFNIEMLSLLSLMYSMMAVSTYLQMSMYEGFFTEGSALRMTSNNQELLREVSGLGICVLVFLLFLVYGRIKKKTNSHSRV